MLEPKFRQDDLVRYIHSSTTFIVLGLGGICQSLYVQRYLVLDRRGNVTEILLGPDDVIVSKIEL